MVLSYRHSFHAGNFADVLKHSTLALLLQHFHSKPKSFYYLDTHTGTPIHDLREVQAQKTKEYMGGIARVWTQRNYPREIEPYLASVRMINSLQPGKPGVTKSAIDYAIPSTGGVRTRRNEYSWRHLLHHHNALDANVAGGLPDLSAAWPDSAFDLSSLRHYPGSSLLSAFFQRQAEMRLDGKNILEKIQDRAVLCELHPAEADALKAYFAVPPKDATAPIDHAMRNHLLSQATRSRIHVMKHSGFLALQSQNSNLFLAPPQGRGLVLVDPPYETTEEQNQLLESLPIAYNRFRNGIYAIWYPLIDYSPDSPKKLDVEVFKSKLQAMGIPKMMCVEFDMKDSIQAARTGLSPKAVLNSQHSLPILDAPSEFAPTRQRGLGMTGTGMILINPTHGFESQMRTLCDFLADTLPVPAVVEGESQPQTYRAKYSIEWLTPEQTGATKAVHVVERTMRTKGKKKANANENENMIPQPIEVTNAAEQ